MAPHRNIWHHPNRTRGFADARPIPDPALLPIPRPKRNTARISEKV
jgi:hypothetical protein